MIYGTHWEATRGTPLLPRDLMIAFMYGRAFALTLEDGRIIRSMASRNDVSKSLDMITNTQGKYLQRGATYWEPVDAPAGGITRARLWLKATLTGVDFSALKDIAFDDGSSDIAGAIDLATDPTRITVPAGITKARVTANAEMQNRTAGQNNLLLAGKTGSNGWAGMPIVRWDDSATTTAGNLTSWIDDVIPGDFFQLRLQTAGDSSINVTTRTWLQVEFW